MTRSYLQPDRRLDAILSRRQQVHPQCAHINPRSGNHCNLHAAMPSRFCEKHRAEHEEGA